MNWFSRMWSKPRLQQFPESVLEPHAKALLDEYKRRLADSTLSGVLDPVQARAQLVGAAQMLELIVARNEASLPKPQRFAFPGTPRRK